jgi:hypothetical protein
MSTEVKQRVCINQLGKLLINYYKDYPIISGLNCPHCIRCSHFKVDDVSALEASSNRSVRIVEDNVTASLHRQRTSCQKDWNKLSLVESFASLHTVIRDKLD